MRLIGLFSVLHSALQVMHRESNVLSQGAACSGTNRQRKKRVYGAYRVGAAPSPPSTECFGAVAPHAIINRVSVNVLTKPLFK